MILAVRTILLFFIFSLLGHTGNNCFSAPKLDSLNRYSFRELDEIIGRDRADSSKVLEYVYYAIQRAKRENNLPELAHYFKNFVFYQPDHNRLAFIDSALFYANLSRDNELIADVYLSKATVHHNRKNYQQTLDNYLIANQYLGANANKYYTYRIKNHIAGLKNYLGYYDEAAALYQECIAYFGRDETMYNMQRGYVSSLEGLAWSYTKTNRIAESMTLLDKASKSARKAGFSDLDLHYSTFKQGINHYCLGHYDDAVSQIQQELPHLYQNEDFAWASIGEFYIGKSYWDRGDKERAIVQFNKVDDVFRDKGYTHPDLRGAYELLINYYREKKDKDNQLKYVEQLVRVDSFYNQNHKHLIGRIFKEYTTKDLSDAKKHLEQALYLQKNKTTIISIVALWVVFCCIGVIYYRQRKAKGIAQELIQKVKRLQYDKEQSDLRLYAQSQHLLGGKSAMVDHTVAAANPTDSIEPTLDPDLASTDIDETAKEEKAPLKLSDTVVERLLSKLEKFEQKHKFLQQNITLEKLANSLGTNTTYLSSVINNYKQRSFSEYLHGLRIDYIVNELVKDGDSVFLRYSFEALAEHLGYSSATTFSRAFQAHTGVKPSVFIKELQAAERVED